MLSEIDIIKEVEDDQEESCDETFYETFDYETFDYETFKFD